MWKFFNNSFVYFFWQIEVPLEVYLICRIQKKSNSPIMLISNSFPIRVANCSHRYSEIAPKMISYTLMMRSSYSLFIRNKVLTMLPLLNPFFMGNFDMLLYQALGSYIKPYRALLSLNTWFGRSNSSNPCCCFTYTCSIISPFKKALLQYIWKSCNPMNAAKAIRILIDFIQATRSNVSS